MAFEATKQQSIVDAEWLDWQPLIGGNIIVWFLEDDEIKSAIL